jgi:UDP-N-acetylenolpyruvoylglucosamine reductase
MEHMTPPHFLEHDRDISFLSAFKTPAKTHFFFDITERDHITLLPMIYAYACEQGIPLMIIGGGSNCLFAFDLFDGIIVRNRYSGYSEPFDYHGRTYVRIHSGEMSTVCALALYQHYGISVLVPWTGLPGTIGGACIGNAGCFGIETADIFVEAEILDLESGEIHTYYLDDMQYVYRGSALKGDETKFVISMLLDVSPYENTEYGHFTPQDIQAIRKVKQPP